MKKIFTGLLLAVAALTSACTSLPQDKARDNDINVHAKRAGGGDVPDGASDVVSDYAGMTPGEICNSLTLEQKAAQMIQPTIYNTPFSDMKDVDYGSILSRNDIFPMWTDEEWKATVDKYQEFALQAEAPVPYFYGNDSVHGVNFASGCVMFPHNINIGAARDEALTEEYGKLVGSDILHTGMILNFAPCVATARDPRWGRTYESYSSESGIVTDMAVAYTRGLLSEGVLVCPKHFFGDGMTAFGSGEDSATMILDRGDARLGEDEIAEQLSIYQALIDEGVQVIMLSHSSLNGTKMHENKKYIDILKKDMGFEGIVLSDWDSIMNCSGANYEENVILGVNAGIDMFMTDTGHENAMKYIIEGVSDGRISQERVDDAVTRIIGVKKDEGLFDDPYLKKLSPSYEYGSERSHEVARQLAAESFVPLKAGDNMYIEPGMKIFVTGPAADDVGALCGGWTNWWQGLSDSEMSDMGISDKHFRSEGPSILEALTEASEKEGFEIVTDPSMIGGCDMVLLCVGEKPYAEWFGDTKELSLTDPQSLDKNEDAIKLAEGSGKPVVTLIVAGRNVLVDDHIDLWDSCIMLYLPGTEGGNAVADVLTKKRELTGTLPMPYYSSVDQIGTPECWHDVGWSALQD